MFNTKHPDAHRAADAFWDYWRENGETHKHGYYESTWGAINAALKVVEMDRERERAQRVEERLRGHLKKIETLAIESHSEDPDA